MSRFLNGVAAACLVAAPAAAQDLSQLGRPATPEEVASWNIDVRPDGMGLPEGSGDVSTGEQIYNDNCSTCHGVFGEGEGRWPVLMGGFGTLDAARPGQDHRLATGRMCRRSGTTCTARCRSARPRP